MKRGIILLASLLLAVVNVLGNARAQSEIVASLDWRNTQLPESTVLRHDDVEGPILEINVNQRDIVSLWSLDRPPVENETHAIRGRIRVQSTSANAQFEMWTCFGDDGDWYSRMRIDLDTSNQDSGWVDFELPFDLGGDYTLDFPPNRMLLALELPDGGLLWISNLDLVQYGPRTEH